MSAYATKNGANGAAAHGYDPMGAATQMGESYMGMMRDSMELSAEWTQRLMSCRSVPEIAEVNADCAKKAFENWMGMMGHMSNAAGANFASGFEEPSKGRRK